MGNGDWDAKQIEEQSEEIEKLKTILQKQFLFNDVFMERFHGYARHRMGCTWDDLTKGDVCTCGLQALIAMYYEIKDIKDGYDKSS